MMLEGHNDRILIVLEKEEKLIASLTRIATEQNIKGGFISGIGALKDVELGYYELEKQTYLRRNFTQEDFELLSLQGNLSLKDHTPYIHLHAILGKQDFSTFGGHLFEATVAVTTEISLLPLGKMPSRIMNTQIGLGLICGFVDE